MINDKADVIVKLVYKKTVQKEEILVDIKKAMKDAVQRKRAKVNAKDSQNDKSDFTKAIIETDASEDYEDRLHVIHDEFLCPEDKKEEKDEESKGELK